MPWAHAPPLPRWLAFVVARWWGWQCWQSLALGLQTPDRDLSVDSIVELYRPPAASTPQHKRKSQTQAHFSAARISMKCGFGRELNWRRGVPLFAGFPRIQVQSTSFPSCTEGRFQLLARHFSRRPHRPPPLLVCKVVCLCWTLVGWFLWLLLEISISIYKAHLQARAAVVSALHMRSDGWALKQQ